jgi:hypothetical protein
MAENKSDPEQELRDLKAENGNLKKYIRPETLKLMKIKEIGAIENNIRKSIYIKYLYTPVAIAAIIFILAASLIYFKFDFNTEPLIEDTALTDPAFVPDSSPENFNIYGNTPGNIFNGGSVAAQGSWTYLAYGNKLFKTENPEKEPSEINIEKTGSSDPGSYINLNIVGNWIYCTEAETGYIYKIRTDGMDKTLLFEEPVKQMTVYKNFIYFINKDNILQRILTTGKKQRTVLSDITVLSFYIYDNIIYYTAEANDRLVIFAHDLVKNLDFLISTTDSNKIVYYNGYIYFSENDYLFKIKPDGTSKQIISTEISDNYNIVGDKIFYISKDTNSLIGMDTDGTDKNTAASPFSDSTDTEYIYNIQDKYIIIKTNTGIYCSVTNNINFKAITGVE